MQKFFRLFILPLLAVGLTLAAPASSPKVTTQTGVHVSDAQLESTIRAKLSKSKIGKDGFKFKVARGVVTWEGSTQIPQHKGAATRMARTSGATEVVNHIQVAGGNKPGIPLKRATVQ
jgi:osmotically-inducible protein OsmY